MHVYVYIYQLVLHIVGDLGFRVHRVAPRSPFSLPKTYQTYVLRSENGAARIHQGAFIIPRYLTALPTRHRGRKMDQNRSVHFGTSSVLHLKSRVFPLLQLPWVVSVEARQLCPRWGPPPDPWGTPTHPLARHRLSTPGPHVSSPRQVSLINPWS